MDRELHGQYFDGCTRFPPADERWDVGRIESALDLPTGVTDGGQQARAMSAGSSATARTNDGRDFVSGDCRDIGVTGDAPAEHRMLVIYGDEDPMAVSGR